MKAANPVAKSPAQASACQPCTSDALMGQACPEGQIALEWFEHAPGFVAFLVGPDLVFAHANDAYKRLVGREHLVGVPFGIALPEVAEQGVAALCHDVLARGERHVERARAVWVRLPSGGMQQRYVDFVLQPIMSADGRHAGLLVQGSDVTMETISQRDLQFSLTHDVLTALPNHTLFHDRLENALRRAARVQGSLQVAALDLDRFNRVNGKLGRVGEERILHDVARRIEHTVGAEATVARGESNRFLILLEGEQLATALELMRKVINVLAEPFDYQGHAVHVSCCVGGAAYPLSGQTADRLLLAADSALKRAKEAGMGMLHWCDSAPDNNEIERLQVGRALRSALANEDLQVHYQPQVDIVTGTICAVEALVRWTKDGESVPAETVISVAEECGLIGDVGEWVLRTACAQTARWREMGFNSLRVAVNLSTRQLAIPNLKSSILSVLSETGLPPASLDLELTESLLMQDLGYLIEDLSALREHGIRLCLDDFGTGYSSLAKLRQLPIDVLKIDGSFLEGVPEKEDASAIVNAVIVMGHSLGMRVIAEAVESEEQCQFLSRHMCDEVQGNYVSVPVAADVMTALLQSGPGLAPHLLRLQRAQPTLLLVDDEASILSSLRRLLRTEGYRILTATSGREGLQVLAENAVDVIVSDQRMPGMTGVEFLRAVRQLHPETVRIVLSGFTELQAVTDAVNTGAIYKFLTKPWDDEQLRSHVQEAFSYSAMANENRLLTLEVRTANQKLAAVNRQLELMLARQRSQIRHGEISLDIVREVLSNLPIPVLASDDLGMIVLANRAALDLFDAHEQVLGYNVRQIFPGFPLHLAEGTDISFEHRLGDRQLSVDLRSMGNGSASRGWLISISSPALRHPVAA